MFDFPTTCCSQLSIPFKIFIYQIKRDSWEHFQIKVDSWKGCLWINVGHTLKLFRQYQGIEETSYIRTTEERFRRDRRESSQLRGHNTQLRKYSLKNGRREDFTLRAPLIMFIQCLYMFQGDLYGCANRHHSRTNDIAKCGPCYWWKVGWRDTLLYTVDNFSAISIVPQFVVQTGQFTS